MDSATIYQETSAANATRAGKARTVRPVSICPMLWHLHHNTCHQNGVCESLPWNFNCKCYPGWEGKSCSTSKYLTMPWHLDHKTVHVIRINSVTICQETSAVYAIRAGTARTVQSVRILQCHDSFDKNGFCNNLPRDFSCECWEGKNCSTSSICLGDALPEMKGRIFDHSDSVEYFYPRLTKNMFDK